MTPSGQQLTDWHIEMINTHDPDLVERYLATDYIDHNVLAADGREAARQFWTAFFTGLPDVEVTRQDLIVSGEVFQQIGVLPPLDGLPA